jgi:hypothetical protein
MESQTINILLTSFSGLGLPPTLSLPTPASTPISTLLTQLTARFPPTISRLTLTTTSNKPLLPSSSHPISTLLPDPSTTLLPLRLTAPLIGGKGGFGSQLRAAGGRMSSRRKKHAGEANSSNRNLDGRRLRTINEAKALAEYLALKPEMERKEKEQRRKRWEQVVEAAERREEEVRSGKGGRVDGRWMEEREEAGERAREAVRKVMGEGRWRDSLGAGTGVGAGGEKVDGESDGDGDEEVGGRGLSSSANGSAIKARAVSSQAFFGFDVDDEFMSDDSQDSQEVGDSARFKARDVEAGPVEGKGKAKL